MRYHKISLLLAATMIAAGTGQAMATSFGSNITMYDGSSDGTTSGWHGMNEDQETEPGMVGNQAWDLEGFFLRGTTLTVAGGFDFKNGVPGHTQYSSGDIFIDTNGSYGRSQAPGGYAPARGNVTYDGNFGYEYAIDLDLANEKYSVYRLDGNARVETVYFEQNESGDPSSNPWRYVDGGTELRTGQDMTYYGGLDDATIGYGLLGGTHYALSIDLSFLTADELGNFMAHYTMGCGNDNLMGGTAPVPEPATMLLFGTGLTGLAGFSRRRMNRKTKDS